MVILVEVADGDGGERDGGGHVGVDDGDGGVEGVALEMQVQQRDEAGEHGQHHQRP